MAEKMLVDFEFTDETRKVLKAVHLNLDNLAEEAGYILKEKAIPIEFIEEYISYQDTEEQRVLRMMWHAWELWENENESNN